MTDELAGRLGDDEMCLLITLLARYFNHDLDQFDDWRLSTRTAAVDRDERP
jgi:hypothetical protein